MKLYVIAFLCSVLVTLLAGYVILPILKKWKVGQTISEFMTESHAAKQGTPTIGGLIFLSGAVLVSVILSFFNISQGAHLYLTCLMCMLVFGALGFADDALKVMRRQNEGLTVKQKLFPQILFAVLIAVNACFSKGIGSRIALPFTEKTLNLGLFYIPVMAIIIVAIDNSANLMDGLDGLLSGSSAIIFAAFGLYALTRSEEGMTNVAVFSFSMSGALVAFHRFNFFPARVFMGDCGSLAIGGAIAGIAIVTKGALLLPFMLIMLIVTTGSDIAQVIYMRRHQGRKLMRMSPLHHHVQMGGMQETTVVTLYNVITFIGCAVALILFA